MVRYFYCLGCKLEFGVWRVLEFVVRSFGSNLAKSRVKPCTLAQA